LTGDTYRYVLGSMLSHLFLRLVILTKCCISRLITVWYLSYFIKLQTMVHPIEVVWMPLFSSKACLTSRRTCFYVLSTGKNWPNRKALARGTCGDFSPQTTRKGPQKSFGMTIIFCVYPAILDSQSARKGLARRKSVTLGISLRMSQV
jgi:hypothetical protein